MKTSELLTIILCANLAVGYLWLGDWAIWKSGLIRSRGNIGAPIGLWPAILFGLILFKMFTHRR